MIVSIQNYKPRGYLKTLFIYILSTPKIFIAFCHRIILKISLRSEERSVRHFPQCKVELCVSCDLCRSLCPPQAISLDGIRGSRPKSFEIDLSSCQSCGLCLDLCPAKALEKIIS